MSLARIIAITVLCFNAIYLGYGTSVNDEQFSIIEITSSESKINLTEETQSCPAVPCRDGFACIENTCVDLCASVTCQANETCLNGQCYVNGTFRTCDDIRCFSGQECFYDQVACLLAPCPPLPTCRSNKSDNCEERGCSSSFFCDHNTGDCIPEAEISCKTVKCSEGFVCVLGRCQPDPCASTRCEEGFECNNGLCEAVSDCANGKCKRRARDCSIMRCRERCVDGRCVSHQDPCAIVKCSRGSHCVNGRCETNTMDLCALTLCAVNTTCVNGECLANGSFATCDSVRCKGGFHCEMEQVQCFTTPCPPIPTCKPDSGNNHDRIGYNPPRKDY